MEVVNSMNIFVDSENALTGRGDNFLVDIGHAGINVSDGQFLRVTLESFNMYKNFYGVNQYNNVIHVNTNLAPASHITLTKQNYKNIGDIATNFAVNLIEKLNADATNTGAFVATVLPASTIDIDGTGDRIIDLGLTFENNGAATAHGISSCVIQCQSVFGESAYLLGADIVTDTDLASQSFTVTIDTNTITIRGKYPAQRSTEEHVYLRTNLSNTNLESQGLSGTTAGSHILSSDILAKIPIDHEFVHFSSRTGREFFLDVPNKSITQMRFYLRDSKDRDIPSAGDGTRQNTKGNTHCSFVLRVDTIEFPHTKFEMRTPALSHYGSALHTGVLQNMR